MPSSGSGTGTPAGASATALNAYSLAELERDLAQRLGPFEWVKASAGTGNAATVPAPTASHACPRRARNACNAVAARTAFGLVNTTTSAASAARNAASVAASPRASMRSGDNASNLAPCVAAARRRPACCPSGRREITYHPSSDCGEAAARIRAACWLGVAIATIAL